jgi:MinD-like ATPase involved in chromosome partitioning or flagellar assembly
VRIKKAQERQTTEPSDSVPNRMFSPATFYDVIATPKGQNETISTIEPLERPVVIAYYGYRGGAGRTIALAHTAVTLARRGLGVLAIDLDLEAPGLHTVLGMRAVADRGAASLLRTAFLADDSERATLDVEAHILRVPEVDDLWIIPAGLIDKKYLATLEELNLPGWHFSERRHPLSVVVARAKQTLPKLDVVLVDCRTGFHPMAATTLFHAADAVVLCTAISPQVWEGNSVFLDAIGVARSHRDGRPALLVLPSMVPPGEVGDHLISEFNSRFQLEHDKRLGTLSEDQASTLENPTRPAWAVTPARYDADQAARGSVDFRRDSSFDKFRSLADAVGRIVGADLDTLKAQKTENLDRNKVLNELQIPKSAAFAEEIPSERIEELFVKSSRHARIEDSHSSLIIGAKGAGKSLFWRWLIRQPTDNRRFIAGHAPRRASAEGGPLILSPDALKELERSAQMTKRGTHKAFWSLYAVAQISHFEPSVKDVYKDCEKNHRDFVKALLNCGNAAALQAAISSLLREPNAGTIAEQLLERVDKTLQSSERPKVTLVYDGLDDGFDVGAGADAMRQRYVAALLQVLGDIRGRYAWIALKIFLREDVWESASLQNRSHLEGGRVDLRWETHDLWQMALRLLRTSKTYRGAIVSPPVDSTSTEELERALDPLWGRFTEGNQTARTANYVKNRMADGLGRFFPRTLVQMLETAVQVEKQKQEGAVGRVIRLRSLQAGIEQASKMRVKDLESEYTILALYLKLFSREQPTGTREEIRNRLQRKWASSMRSTKEAPKKGVRAGVLHAGKGGWMNVVQFLETVGVLGPRDGTEDKLQVALLYRPGLGIPSYGG